MFDPEMEVGHVLSKTLALPLRSAAFKFFLASALSLAITVAWLVNPARALNVDVTHYTLDNGMQVVIIPDRRAPVVTHMVWYKVGSADEQAGETGIAHFLEHLLFKGTDKVPAGELSKIIRNNGGQDNAFTSLDYTAYYQRIAKDRLDLVMGLEADRMANLTLTDADVLPERAVVQEERRSRTDNDPSSLLQEQTTAALYIAHPYGRPVIGWMSDVQGLTRQDALEFYRKYYTPGNAILVIAGDVEIDVVRKLVDKHFAPLKNTAQVVERVRTPEPEPLAARRVIMSDPRAANPTVQRSYLTSSYRTAPEREAEAMEILAHIVGSGTTSRLYRQLVVEQQLAAYAGAWYDGNNRDSGTFGVYGAPAPGKDTDEVEKAIDTVLEDILKNGVTDDELTRAKNKLLADTVYTLDSQFRLAYLFGAALTIGSTIDDVKGWSGEIEKVTAADVKQAAQKFLAKQRSVTGVLLPASRDTAATTPDTTQN
jgi:zinc protease